ncbi:MAG: FAD-dependent oxidoreductase [Desulfobacteraceae bacterium]|nr:FAD-dependent oxidoreductase [Desulfobacteraceae bacterium]
MTISELLKTINACIELAKDFKRIDPKLSRIILIEAGPRILPSFSKKMSGHATRDLEKLGVEVWVNKRVTCVAETGVVLGEERILASTVIWAAGIAASGINNSFNLERNLTNRIIVESDLSLKGFPEFFVAGDQARVSDKNGNPLPGLAPVAQQQGQFIAETIKREIKGKSRKPFQ